MRIQKANFGVLVRDKRREREGAHGPRTEFLVESKMPPRTKRATNSSTHQSTHRITHAASSATNAAPKETRFPAAALVITAVVLADGEDEPLPPPTVPLPPADPEPEPEPEPEPDPPFPEPPAPVGFVGVPGRVAVAPPAPPPPTAVPPTVTTLPAPAEIPGEPASAPLPVATGGDTAVAPSPPEPPPVAVVAAPPPADEDEEEGDEDEALHDRSYSGVVDRELPTTPKLGEGVVGAASCSVYHHVFVLPKSMLHPTSSQYFSALAVLASAWFAAGPLTGHPVSVTQTSLPLAAACVAPNASLKREAPLEMPFAIVVLRVGSVSIHRDRDRERRAEG